jgi:hypothetical protein
MNQLDDFQMTRGYPTVISRDPVIDADTAVINDSQSTSLEKVI